jgi:enoyl-CoA hydratase/carnithine racemase
MIDLEISEGVAFITLNAPATRNALNNELAAQFVAACDEADRDPSVGAAVIRGAGGTFCSGAERGHLVVAPQVRAIANPAVSGTPRPVNTGSH